MASNTTLNSGSGGDIIVSKERSHDGDTAKQQGVFVSSASGTEGAYTWTDLQVAQVDVAAGASDTGIAPLAIRDDALTTLTPIDGDYVNLRVGSTGALWTTVSGTVTVNGSGVTQPVSAASLPLPSGAATAANQSTIIGHVDGIEALLTTIDADTGTLAGAVSGTEMQVDVVASLPAGTNNIGDVDVLSVVPGTGATNLGKAEDAAHSSGDTGVMALAVRQDTTAALAGTTGDYIPLTTNATGHLRAGSISESAYRNVDANAEAAIKGSAGVLNWIQAINLTNAIAYLHLYNATTASVTPGTTTPTFTFPVPTTGTASQGGGFNIKLDHYFSTAITLVVTTTIDGSTGDPGTNGVMVNAGYT